MDPFEYLEYTKDLVEKLENELAPLQEKLRQDIYAAEEKCAQTIAAPYPEAEYIQWRWGGDQGTAMASYMFKWREMDAHRTMERETAEAEMKYLSAAQPLMDAHERRIQERLDAR